MSAKLWRLKMDSFGNETKAAVRARNRYNKKYVYGKAVASGCLVDHESRKKLGYTYLEYSCDHPINDENHELFCKYGLENGWVPEKKNDKNI